MDKAIGVFDSGIGGLSILNSLVEKLPYENFIYLSDNKNCPYGNKSQEQIINFSLKNSKKLIELNCKMIIVACNTATTNSIDLLREKIDIPIIGIEPGIRPAILNTKSKNIGVLATEKTLESKLFNSTSKNNLTDGITIHEQIGYGLVNEIEKGVSGNILIEKYLKKYVTPMIEKNIDYLVLGCTHYNFLEEKLNKLFSKNVKIVDTISPVTNHVIKTLENLKIKNNSISKNSVNIYYNGNKILSEFTSNNYEISYLDF